MAALTKAFTNGAAGPNPFLASMFMNMPLMGGAAAAAGASNTENWMKYMTADATGQAQTTPQGLFPFLAQGFNAAAQQAQAQQAKKDEHQAMAEQQ